MPSIINVLLLILLVVLGFGIFSGISLALYAAWLLAWSVVACLVYGFDKFRAQRSQWRVSEMTLNLLALVGGAWVGMGWFRHKTKHAMIKGWLWISTLLHIGLLYFVITRQ